MSLIWRARQWRRFVMPSSWKSTRIRIVPHRMELPWGRSENSRRSCSRFSGSPPPPRTDEESDWSKTQHALNKANEPMKNLLRLFRYARPYRGPVALAIFSTVVVSALGAAPAGGPPPALGTPLLFGSG